MNSFRTSERLSSLLAFALSGLLHIAVGMLVIVLAQRNIVEKQPAMGPKAVNLSFAQIELQAVSASPAESAPVPVLPTPPPEPADVALEEIQKPPEPEPQVEPVATRPAEASEAPVSTEAQTAQTAQSASAPGAQIEAAEPLAGSGQSGEINWRDLAMAKVNAMIEREKKFPSAAERAGYYTGDFKALIRLESDGTIASYEITERHGHPLLGRGVESMLSKIQGRNIGMRLPKRFEFTQPFVFVPPP